MPTWTAPPTEGETYNTLNEIWLQLNDEVRSSPPFEDVAGLTTSELFEHATTAVSAFASEARNFNDPMALIQLYMLGFVVGSRYGEKRRTNP